MNYPLILLIAIVDHCMNHQPNLNFFNSLQSRGSLPQPAEGYTNVFFTHWPSRPWRTVWISDSMEKIDDCDLLKMVGHAGPFINKETTAKWPVRKRGAHDLLLTLNLLYWNASRSPTTLVDLCIRWRTFQENHSTLSIWDKKMSTPVLPPPTTSNSEIYTPSVNKIKILQLKLISK